MYVEFFFDASTKLECTGTGRNGEEPLAIQFTGAEGTVRLVGSMKCYAEMLAIFEEGTAWLETMTEAAAEGA